MPKGKLKSLALLCCVAALAASLLVISLGGFLSLTTYGLAWCGAMLLLTAAVSRLTVPISGGDGVGKNYKSVADAFIFLTGMMFGIGPASLLAGVDGFL